MNYDLKDVIIHLIANGPISPADLHCKLNDKGYPSNDIRNELSRMWDEGEIKLDSNRLLRILHEEGAG